MSDLADSKQQRLYHFTAAKFALDDLRHARLKIAQISDLNDPFELKCMDTSGGPNMRWAYDAWKDEVSANYGVLCFSERWDDILQWSHYADRHRGVCLGFDVAGSPAKFGKVRYVSEKDPRPEKPDQAFIWRSLTSKFRDWAYEREWRVFTTLKDGVWSDWAGREIFFADFGKELVLREVFLGSESETRATEIFDAIANYETKVRVARVHLADSTFELELTDCVRV
jgi:hypothetical protein